MECHLQFSLQKRQRHFSTKKRLSYLPCPYQADIEPRSTGETAGTNFRSQNDKDIFRPKNDKEICRTRARPKWSPNQRSNGYEQPSLRKMTYWKHLVNFLFGFYSGVNFLFFFYSSVNFLFFFYSVLIYYT